MKLSNLCTSGGLPASCVYTVAFTDDTSGSTDSSGTGSSSSSNPSSSGEDSRLITSQVYSIDDEILKVLGFPREAWEPEPPLRFCGMAFHATR